MKEAVKAEVGEEPVAPEEAEDNEKSTKKKKKKKKAKEEATEEPAQDLEEKNLEQNASDKKKDKKGKKEEPKKEKKGGPGKAALAALKEHLKKQKVSGTCIFPLFFSFFFNSYLFCKLGRRGAFEKRRGRSTKKSGRRRKTAAGAGAY